MAVINRTRAYNRVYVKTYQNVHTDIIRITFPLSADVLPHAWQLEEIKLPAPTPQISLNFDE